MKLKTILLAGASLLAMTSHAWSFEMLGSLIISAFLAVPGGIAILPVASAAAIGQAVVGVALLAANIATSFMQRRPAVNPGEFKNTFEDTGSQSEIRAVGRVRAGGLKVFGNTKGLDRYRLIAHARGRWSATEEHFLGGREVTVEDDGAVSSPPWTFPGGSYVYIRSKAGDGTETAWPQLMAAFPDLWTSSHRVRGIFQSLVHYVSPGLGSNASIAKFQKLYQNGEPPYEVVGRAEPVFDPREGGQSATDEATWAWSDNGILCAAHVLRSFPNIAATDLDYSLIGAEATLADDAVPAIGGAKPRARASGFWTSESARGDIMEQVLRSIGAEIVQTDDNRYTLRLIDDARTADVAFGARHIVGIEWRAGPESVERPNVCRVRYYAAERNYEMADVDLSGIAWARIQSEVDRVGEQYYDVDLPFCADASQAQRIARRLFALARADAGTVTLNMAGLAAWGQSTASIYFPDIDVTEICAIGTPRVDDEAGTVSLPFIVWPDLPEWDPETDEAPAPEPIPDMQYPSELDTPAAPAEYAQVIYPGGARELRIRFAGVTGGTIAEATRRNYSGANPNPWASMTEYLGHGGSNWYAYAGVDWEGDDADFRVRFFNSAEEGSYWSPLLSPRPVAAPNNSATGAPTIISAVATDVNDGVVLTFKAGELRAVRAVVQYDWEGSGWTTDATVDPLRPDTIQTVTMDGFNNLSPFNQNLNWRVATLTSNGTVGAYATGSVVIPGTGGP